MSVQAVQPARFDLPVRARSTFLRHLTTAPLSVSLKRKSNILHANQNGSAGPLLAQQSSRNDDREEMLWQRQQHLWDREMQRWDAERLAWTQREAFLLQQIAKLQAALMDYAIKDLGAASGASRLIGSAASAAPTQSEELPTPAQMPGTRQPHEPSGTTSPPQTTGTPAVTQRAHAEEQQDIVVNGLFDVSDLQALYDGKAADMGDSTWIADLANAIAAPDYTDVLTEESPFSSVPTTRGGIDDIDTPLDIPPIQALSHAAGDSGDVGQSAPALAHGADDIFWVNQLHTALHSKGYHPGDEEMEVWLFGDQTLSALLTFQASAGLPETGVCDDATWISLLGKETLKMRLIEAAALTLLEGSNATTGEDVSASGSSKVSSLSSESAQSEAAMAPTSSEQSSKNGIPRQLRSWPIMREGDGGAEVHGLQVALNNCGYYCGEDDTVWWQFGGDTYSSLLTFQACNNLAETGVADAATWKALLGPDASPSDVLKLQSGDDTDDDLQASDSVWLLGEQRWEVRSSQ